MTRICRSSTWCSPMAAIRAATSPCGAHRRPDRDRRGPEDRRPDRGGRRSVPAIHAIAMSEPAAPAPRRASLMNRLVVSALRQPFLVVLMTVVLIGAGARSLDRLPVDAYPDLSPPIVEVITQWPGHAAEEVERLITVPVESQMNGIARMTRHPFDLPLRPVRRDHHVSNRHRQLFCAPASVQPAQRVVCRAA